MSHRFASTLALVLLVASTFFVSVAVNASLEAGLRAKDRGHYATAIRAWKPLAKKGDARAQNNIGHMYEEGLGVAQNYSEAMTWYKKAAESKLPEAEYNVGLLYYHGYGVAKNLREAIKWFKSSSRKNLPEAQYMMGLAHHEGKGVRLDYREALSWFAKSAKQNHPPAQFMSGFMYQAGEGMEPDPMRAYAWSKLAELNKQPESDAIYNLAALSLDKKQVLQAQTVARMCFGSALTDCPLLKKGPLKVVIDIDSASPSETGTALKARQLKSAAKDAYEELTEKLGF